MGLQGGFPTPARSAIFLNEVEKVAKARSDNPQGFD
jgi:hypothetical protein